MSSCKQNWSSECENELNQQINREFQASYYYYSLYCYFSRDTVGLDNIAKFFKKAYNEEKEHAEILSDYQNLRGGIISLSPINLITMENQSENKNDVYCSFESALHLEKMINQHLLNLHKTAEKNNDPQFTDFLEGNFLKEQVDSINQISKILANLNRIGNDGHGIWDFNKNFDYN
tara:strand:- start:2136 stop:2663 length:528 start_codon:yes stop_codon:yes gene_type:complete